MTMVTHDSIALRGTGVVNLRQPKKGVRFTLDSLILADFCNIKRNDRILELGAGTGIISLLLARRFPFARIVADENEPFAYALLCSNIESNGLGGRIAPVDHDIHRLGRSLHPAVFDVIVANPPYGISGAGIPSASPVRQIARHGRPESIKTWIDRHDLLKNGGRYYLIFPAHRVAELLSTLRETRLEPKRVRFVHPYATKPASLVLVQAVKEAKTGVEVVPPLVVHKQGGRYSEEMTHLYGLSRNDHNLSTAV